MAGEPGPGRLPGPTAGVGCWEGARPWVGEKGGEPGRQPLWGGRRSIKARPVPCLGFCLGRVRVALGPRGLPEPVAEASTGPPPSVLERTSPLGGGSAPALPSGGEGPMADAGVDSCPATAAKTEAAPPMSSQCPDSANAGNSQRGLSRLREKSGLPALGGRDRAGQGLPCWARAPTPAGRGPLTAPRGGGGTADRSLRAPDWLPGPLQRQERCRCPSHSGRGPSTGLCSRPSSRKTPLWAGLPA